MSASAEFQFDRAMEDGQFLLHFQPRVSARSSRLIGVEALLRWRRGDGSIIAPPFSIANWTSEELSRLWSWKLAEVEKIIGILKGRVWRPTSEKNGFTISLNLSPKQLHSDEWAVQLLQMIERARISGCCIEVELIDGGGGLNATDVNWAFDLVQKAGVVLALDDFPAGASGFLRFSNYKFDKVKIDKAMIPSAHEPVAVWSRRRELLMGLANMVKSMGAEVALKGIEREIQLNFFREVSATEWQGYYWGGAVEFSKILDLLTNTEMVARAV